MRFKFDANQAYQLQAVQSVVDLFSGQPSQSSLIQFKLGEEASIAAIPNQLDLEEAEIVKNLREVQERNGITADSSLAYIEGTVQGPTGEGIARFPNFSVEMETGTGKTYVYLRTVHQLSKDYGWTKFIIVVPSVAVREGVVKTLQITETHFRKLFDNPVCHFYRYDSDNPNQVKHFSLSEAIEVMVMTIDSFNKASNLIRQPTDRLQGETPIHFIQAARPILILDEPQNMESEGRIAALAELDPLFALRYSATHKKAYNIVYRLSPAEAYRQGLVKRIEVDSVLKEGDANHPFVALDKITVEKTRITAKIRVQKLQKSGIVKESPATVKPGESLVSKSNRQEYAGYEIDEINPGAGFVRFANNVELREGEAIGSDKDAVFAAQIHHTIEEHFRKQARLKNQGIKVLSLFFIDRVDNYAGDPDPNDPEDRRGSIRRMFDHAFNQLKEKYPEWRELQPDEMRTAYFASKKKQTGEVELLDSKSGESSEDAAAFDLIMRDKESLLTLPSPADDAETRKKRQYRFIFSHTALKEGWDNPNVFQICTLNQTASAIKKRQEVGRGVRLAVNQKGDRVHEEQVNVLTVIANESYRSYVERYQSEIADEYQAEIESRYGKSIADLTDEERRRIADEYGEGILPPPPKEKGRTKARLRKARALSDDFKALWDRIKHRTRYKVTIDTEKLIEEALPEIDALSINPPRIAIVKSRVDVAEGNIFTALQMSAAKTASDLSGRYPLPNIINVLSNLLEQTSSPVKLTRRTLLEVFKRTKTQGLAVKNPHEWAAGVSRILKEKLADHLVNGVQYEKTGAWYEMSQLLDAEEVDLFAKHIVDADPDEEKAIYDRIPCDSGPEVNFVRDLEARSDVRLYVKLPKWFSVPTPVGLYEPDWAIVMDNPEEDGKPTLYLVSETKSSTAEKDLRPNERRKILCGAAHFGSKQFQKVGALEDVDFKVVTNASELP